VGFTECAGPSCPESLRKSPHCGNSIRVNAGREIAVTSVITWKKGTWEETCGIFVRFTPEKGATYVVVNERIGGKGLSALWTGVGRQTGEVSVYREAPSGPVSVPTRETNPAACHVSVSGGREILHVAARATAAAVTRGE
jgi:hypothetical protein